MQRNKLVILFLLFSMIVFCQEKKVDTIYVYEEIIVHDTVYISKPLEKINFDKIIVTVDENSRQKLDLIENGKKIPITADTIIQISAENPLKSGKPKTKKWAFYGKAYLGLTNNSLFKEMAAPSNKGIGLGLQLQRRLGTNWNAGLGVDGFYWASPFSFNANENDSALNGYYFINGKPKLFQGIDSKHFQVQSTMQISYTINRFTPAVGILAGFSQYRAEFLGSSENLPMKFDRIEKYKAQAFQLGYIAELQYRLTAKVSVGASFSWAKADRLVFISADDSAQFIKTRTPFNENRFLAEIIYRLR